MNDILVLVSNPEEMPLVDEKLSSRQDSLQSRTSSKSVLGKARQVRGFSKFDKALPR